MAGLSIVTLGDGKLHSLQEKGYKSDGQVYAVLLVCAKYNLEGVVNSNGVAVGFDHNIIQWLGPGDSITLLTNDLGTVCWQDASGAASILTVAPQLPAEYILRPR
jgi:hypothetical protein